MTRFRSCSSFPCNNGNFFCVLIALILIYVLLVYQFLVKENYFSPWFYIITFFYLMTMWSYTAVVVTDPGRVPSYWGILTQTIPGQRKYCLICHNFKPQRSHHCSKCGRCVLNMDHHCPWINNCVGFENRKYFILFIIYLLLSITASLILMMIIMVNQISLIISGSYSPDIHFILKILLIFIFLALQITLFMFAIAHLKYVIVNTTTLEQMVMERKKRAAQGNDGDCNQIYEDSQYNINCYYNFTQVFGENAIYWFFPLEQEKKLEGRGLYWRKRTDKNVKNIKMETQTIHGPGHSDTN